MDFPRGNRLWEVRVSHGRDKIFSTPEILWESCCEYFAWVEENPLMEVQAFAYQGKVTKEKLPKMRAMTLAGLAIFLGIERQTWDLYRKYPDYEPVCGRVDEIIRDQKFSGAAAGLLNPGIIARDLGLSEKNEHTGLVQVNISSDDAGLL